MPRSPRRRITSPGGSTTTTMPPSALGAPRRLLAQRARPRPPAECINRNKIPDATQDATTTLAFASNERTRTGTPVSIASSFRFQLSAQSSARPRRCRRPDPTRDYTIPRPQPAGRAPRRLTEHLAPTLRMRAPPPAAESQPSTCQGPRRLRLQTPPPLTSVGRTRPIEAARFKSPAN